jgi:hypothetical protein
MLSGRKVRPISSRHKIVRTGHIAMCRVDEMVFMSMSLKATAHRHYGAHMMVHLDPQSSEP